MARAAREGARGRGSLPDLREEAYFEARLRQRLRPYCLLHLLGHDICIFGAIEHSCYGIICNSQVLSATSISIFSPKPVELGALSGVIVRKGKGGAGTKKPRIRIAPSRIGKPFSPLASPKMA